MSSTRVFRYLIFASIFVQTFTWTGEILYEHVRPNGVNTYCELEFEYTLPAFLRLHFFFSLRSLIFAINEELLIVRLSYGIQDLPQITLSVSVIALVFVSLHIFRIESSPITLIDRPRSASFIENDQTKTEEEWKQFSSIEMRRRSIRSSNIFPCFGFDWIEF